MNWSVVSACADVLGASAVIISLGYVAYQVKDARKSFIAGAQQQLGGDFSAFMASLWSDEDVFALWNKAVNHPDQLTDIEQQRYGMIMFSMFAHFSNVFELAKIDQGFLIRYIPVMDRMLSMERVRSWWGRQSHSYAADSEFRKYIDRRIVELLAQKTESQG